MSGQKHELLEYLHIHNGLENDEKMRIIMSIEGLASFTKIAGAVDTEEPFSIDLLHTAIAEGSFML
jgi:hypothetical protein